MKAIDIELNEAKSDGVAYYRIDPQFKEFLLKCKEKHGVIGFEYDFDGLNFGVILGEQADETP
jgi:hypothetical protein